jgi:hypothetical protein
MEQIKSGSFRSRLTSIVKILKQVDSKINVTVPDWAEAGGSGVREIAGAAFDRRKP